MAGARTSSAGTVLVGLLVAALLPACMQQTEPRSTPEPGMPGTVEPWTEEPSADPFEPVEADEPARGLVTLAFAGDIHFENHLRALLDRRPAAALGRIVRTLRHADLTMVNLESAITLRGTPEPKDYHFRTSPAALDFLAAAGVDVVSLANNHAIDYGPVGLRDTLAAVADSPIPVLGIGEDRRAAFRPYQVEVRGTDIAFLAATSEPERAVAWAAGPAKAGIATALEPRPRALLAAVRRAATENDVVVVYLHWGAELVSCPTGNQLAVARALAAEGADVIVGSHAHVLLGSGRLDRTYVNYGLGNFIWYHNVRAESGVLNLRIEDGEVVDDAWLPALIQPSGVPVPVTGSAAEAARQSWRQLRGCAGLADQRAS